MSGRHFASTLVIAVVSCTALVGCASDLASPVSPATASALHGGIPAARGTNARGCQTHIASSDSGVFGPQGGTLTFGTSMLIIPGGALRDTVTISATIPEGDASRVEFRPQGLQFRKAAGLLLDTSGCSYDAGEVPAVVYLSESGAIVETIPAVYDPHWHTIAAPIHHFSGYAIAF